MGALPGWVPAARFPSISPAQNLPLYHCSAEVELWSENSDCITGDCRSRCGTSGFPVSSIYLSSLHTEVVHWLRSQNQWLLKPRITTIF